jgi:hypothetical protein
MMRASAQTAYPKLPARQYCYPTRQLPAGMAAPVAVRAVLRQVQAHPVGIGRFSPVMKKAATTGAAGAKLMFQTADAAGRHPQQRQRSIDYPDSGD